MNASINVGVIDNANQFSIITLLDGEAVEKVVSTEDLDKEHLHLLLYKKEVLEISDINELLSKTANHCPLKNLEELSLSKDEIKKQSFSDIYKVYESSVENWRLQNNIVLLESLFEYADHMKKLWPNDRTAFFEELWFILKKNLGASEIKVIYNDIKPASKNSDKKNLIQVTVEGKRNPNPKEGGEFEQSLMNQFADEFAIPYNVAEYDESKGQLVLTALINESPLIVMAEVPSFSRLQSSVLSALIQSISR